MYEVVQQDVLLKAVPSASMITSITVSSTNSELYLGYSTGALLVYSITTKQTLNENNSYLTAMKDPKDSSLEKNESNTIPSCCQLIHSNPTFSKKSIDALYTYTDPNLLLCFSDNSAAIYARDSLNCISELKEVKNPFSADFTLMMAEKVHALAIGLHRKLLLYKFRAPFSIVNKREYFLSVASRSISFHPNAPFIAVASSKEISLLNLDTGEVTSLFSWNTTSFSLRSSIKTKVHYKSQAMLFAFNFQHVFKLEDEVQSKSDWLSPLEDFTCLGPFVVGLLQGSKTVQIKLNQKLIQSIPFPSPIQWCSTSNSIYTLDSTNLTRLSLFPLEDILLKLRKTQNYDDCISVIEAYDLSNEEKHHLLYSTRLAYAYSLFHSHMYSEAMHWFKELCVPPSSILRLYPLFPFLDLLCKEFQYPIPFSPFLSLSESSSSLHDSVEARKPLARYLLEWRSILNRSRTLPSSSSSFSASSSSLEFPSFKSSTLTSIHSSTSSSSSLTSTSSLLLSKLFMEWTSEELMIESVLVDTALLQLYLIDRSDAMLGPLVRVKNYCHIKIASELLKSHKKFSELIDFYQGKEMHHEALAFIRQLSAQTEENTLPFFDHFTTYLSYLQFLEQNNTYFPLIFEHLIWVLKKDSKRALEYLYHSSMPWNQIIQFLASVSISFVLEFIEHHLQDLNDKDELSQEELTVHLDYLNYLILGKKQAPEIHNYTAQLRSYLETTTEGILHHALEILSETQFEEQLIIHKRLKNYSLAFHILIEKIKDLKRAQMFVNEIHLFHDELVLACQRLSPEELDTFLTVHAEYLSLETLLHIFSLITPLKQIHSILAKAYARCQAQVHQSTLTRNLALKEKTMFELQWAQLQLGSIIIDETVVCHICNKRIATSAFVTWKDTRKLVHYGCQSSLAF